MADVRARVQAQNAPKPAVQAPKPAVLPIFDTSLDTATRVRLEAERQAATPHNIDAAAQKLVVDQDYNNLYNQAAGAGALNDLRSQRAPEVQQLIKQAMAQSQGLSASDQGGLRQQALSTVNSQNQAALRQMRGQQAASGIRGGLAAAQMGQQNAAASQALAEQQRNLITTQLAARQQGLEQAAKLVGNEENVIRNQAADRLSAILGGRQQFGYSQSAIQQAQAASNSGGK